MIDETKMYTKIADFVKTQRFEKRLSQQQLAKLAGVGLRTLLSVEAGEKVRSNTISKVLDALGYEATMDITFTKK